MNLQPTIDLGQRLVRHVCSTLVDWCCYLHTVDPNLLVFFWFFPLAGLAWLYGEHILPFLARVREEAAHAQLERHREDPKAGTRAYRARVDSDTNS